MSEIKKTIMPIIPFDMIYDTDYGLIKTICNKYRDGNTFLLDIVDADDKDIINLLVKRTDKNPLAICAKDLSPSDMEDLYQDFFKKEYQTIVDNSMETSFRNAVGLFCNSNGSINPTIICKNEIETNKIRSDELLKNAYVIEKKDMYAGLDTSPYDPIYFKYFIDALRCKTLDAKNIYVANYKFNLDKEDEKWIPDKDISVLLLDHNRCVICDVYNITDDYESVG